MRRRQFLTAAGLASIAGCSGTGPNQAPTDSPTPTPTLSPTPTPTPTATPSPTPTPTPTPEPSPEVTLVNLISRWEEFGDVEEHQMDGAGVGGYILIGFRYSIALHEGIHNALQQVRIFDSSGTRVGMNSYEDRQLVSGSGPSQWENRLQFETTTLDTGEYTAEVIVQDLENGKVSEPMETSFELVPPLGPDEAELLSVDAKDTVTTGESYSFTAEVGNTSERDSSVVSTVSQKYESSDSWTVSDGKIFQMPLAAAGWNTWTSGEVSYNYAGTVQIRIDAIKESWTVDVSEN